MKKILSIMLAFAMLLALVACTNTGASNTPAEQPSSEGEPETPAVDMNVVVGFGGGASGGGFYTFSNVLALALTEAKIGNFAAQATTGGTNNLLLMEQGTLGIAVVNGVDATEAYTGSNEAFDGHALKKLRAICQWDGAVSALTVSMDINDFEELKGKKVVVGAPGSGEYNHFNRIFKVADFGWDDIDAQMLGAGEGKEALQNGLAVCQLNQGGIPYAALTELCLTGKIHVISFPEYILQGLCDVEGAPYNRGVIPANTYENQPEDIQTIAMPYGIYCTEDSLTEDQVYKICEYVFSHNDELAQQYATAHFDEEQSANFSSTVPYHPGAIKYYEEKGLM